MRSANQITEPNAGGLCQYAIPTPLAARVGQFWRSLYTMKHLQRICILLLALASHALSDTGLAEVPPLLKIEISPSLPDFGVERKVVVYHVDGAIEVNLTLGEDTRGIAGGPSEQTLLALKQVRFESFEYAKEKASVDARLTEEAERRGETYMAPAILDGETHRIAINYDGVHFEMKEHNAGDMISFYAKHSAKIRKLRDFIETLSSHYGRQCFGVYGKYYP